MAKEEAKKEVAQIIFNSSDLITAKEISENSYLHKSTVYEVIKQLVEENVIEKVEESGCASKYVITDYGRMKYDLKPTAKSPLEQTVKTEPEPVQAEQVLDESALEQKSVVKLNLITEKKVEVVPEIKRDLNPEHFMFWKKIEAFGDEVIKEIIDKNKPKPIENLDHKVDLLLRLADNVLFEPRLRASLHEIVRDLRS
jgi:predicted transcriptional regulator